MDIQELLPGLKKWFDAYTHQFDSQNRVVQKSMDLKRDHTRRVCEAAVDIGHSLRLSAHDLAMAEAAALLHDIGRFEQYRRYRTFSDSRSADHAALGVKVIDDEGVLEPLDSKTAGVIRRVVKYHNRAALPAHADPRCLFSLKLIRDADKVDIWHVVTDYYRTAANGRNPTIELDLPDTPEISDKVHETLMEGRLVQMTDLRTLNDFKMLQMGWVYDLNFPRTFEMVAEKGYLDMLRDALPRGNSRVADVYAKTRAHLKRNNSPR
ncbi:MAG: HD domain-containing protein [Deltaproteobacteria bacterium]|nr:HD domain-containing protein [Deltaproteobacteria bacterium]